MDQGVGIDLMDVRRLEAALARRPALRDRLFRPDEHTARDGTPRSVRSLAARFCAKEAVTKALRLDAFRPLEIEVVGNGGPPEVRLYGTAEARAEELGVEVVISLTHERESAAAVAWAVHPAPVPA
ncbi:holo-ACP synthase [Patulibacter minatonensis]|uniref:holo-ACP synthase n=1 Tax=Patulibacter minatonensis TaxID=298163 RepID=UPI00047A8364|nr:holo-ACP synthase [Patulibacter minatonensis]